MVEQSRVDSTKKKLEIGHMLMAINNLYDKCTSQDAPPHISHKQDYKPRFSEDTNIQIEEAAKKLSIIRAYMTSFRQIVVDAPRNNLSSEINRTIDKLLRVHTV